MCFITPILDRINFFLINKKHINQTIRPFLEQVLTYENKNFIFNGRFDFAIARGDIYPESPYFFIQEFKQSEDTNPRPQLLAEMISAVEINNTNRIRGAFIIGQYWTFVTLHKIKEDTYEYYFSESYNSMKIEELKDIYRLLLFVKYEIKEKFVKN
jgi:hypothetical protein